MNQNETQTILQKGPVLNQHSDKINQQKHQKQRTNRKLEEKIYHKNQKKNLRNDKHHDSEIMYEKITNFSAHNLKF